MLILKVILLLVGAYLLGSVPFGFIAVKFFRKMDIRDHGSGNIGATNVVRVCGKGLGYPVFLLDFSKGLVPVILANQLLGGESLSSLLFHLILILAAIFAVAGHNWTCFLSFKGGKGVATTVGGLLALSIILAFLRIPLLAAIATWIVLFFSFRIVSLGSIAAGIIFALASLFIPAVPVEFKVLAVLLCSFIIFRHKKNFAEIKNKFQKK